MARERTPLTMARVEKAQPPRDGDALYLWDTKVPGFGVRIYPRNKSTGISKRTYILQYRTKLGQQRRLLLGQHGPLTTEEARQLAREALGTVQKGGDPAGEAREARESPTVRELCERYLAEHARARKKPKSAGQDARMIQRFILPALGHKKVLSVARGDVLRLHQSLSATPYQANRVLALLSKMLNVAELWGLRPDGTNPCRHVPKYKEQRRERFLSDVELGALAEALAEAESVGAAGTGVIAAVRLLLFTGARLSEVLSLRWEYVDLEHQCVRLPDSKTGAKTIHLNAPALETLTSLGPKPDGWVIPGGKPDAHLMDLEKAWQRLRARATVRLWAQDERAEVSGLVIRLARELDRAPTAAECMSAAEEAGVTLPRGLLDVRLHDLRHSFASVAVAGGLSLPMIGALLGHAQPQTTARYAHLAGDPLRQAADVVGARLLRAMQAVSSIDEPAAPVPLRRA